MNFREMKNTLLILAGAGFLLIMGLSVGGRGATTIVERGVGMVLIPVQTAMERVGRVVDQGVEPFLHLFEYRENNVRLNEENAQLKQEISQLLLEAKEHQDLKELEKSLRFVRRQGIDHYLSADVVAKDTGNLYNLFVINAGVKEGVTKNSAVINGDGLVGLVYEVSDHYAKVVAIIDTKATISFETLRSPDHDGMLSGTGQKTLRGYLFDPNATIDEDQVLVTSGLGILPKGIVIGRVESVMTGGDQLLTEMTVEPMVDFHKVNHVLVIPFDEDQVISGDYIEE